MGGIPGYRVPGRPDRETGCKEVCRQEALDPAEVSGMLLTHLVELAQRFADDDISGAVGAAVQS